MNKNGKRALIIASSLYTDLFFYAVDYIRKHYQDVTITGLVQPRLFPQISASEVLDDLILYERKGRFSAVRGLEYVKKIRGLNFDLIFWLYDDEIGQGYLSTDVFALASSKRSQKYIVTQKKEVVKLDIKEFNHLYLRRSIKIIPRTMTIVISLSIFLLVFLLVLINDLLFGLIRGKVCFKRLRFDRF